MVDPPRLSVDLLRSYFNNMNFSNSKYIVSITILTDENQIAFEVSLDCKEPSTGGAFPQRKYSLERHDGPGHEGVHLQISYHLVDNDMGVGKLYITLEIDSDEDLLHIAEGFVYTLYEILINFDDEMIEVVQEIFNLDSLEMIKERKTILIEKMANSLENNRIQISDTFKKKTVISSGDDFKKLIKERKELIPLIGPLV